MSRKRKKTGTPPALNLQAGWGKPWKSEVVHLFKPSGSSLCGQIPDGYRAPLTRNVDPWKTRGQHLCEQCAQAENAQRTRIGRPTWRKQDEGEEVQLYFLGQERGVTLIPPGTKVMGKAIPWPFVYMWKDLWVVTYDPNPPSYTVVGHLPSWAKRQLDHDMREVVEKPKQKEVVYSD